MLAFMLYSVHVLVCIFLILVVLLQQGKGADLSVFGGGGTMTAFGARGAATLLHKLTVTSFVVFIITTLSIGILQGKDSGSSVMADVPATEKAVDDAVAETASETAAAVDEAVEDTAAAVEEAGSDLATDAETTEAPSADAEGNDGGGGETSEEGR